MHHTNLTPTRLRAATLAVVLLGGCSGPRATTPTPEDRSLSLLGRVATPGEQPEQISIAAITGAGEIIAITEAPLEADAEGRFATTILPGTPGLPPDIASALASESTPGPAPGLLIVLSHGSNGQRAAVTDTSSVVRGQLALPVLDAESTVETQVVLTARLAGWWTGEIPLHSLRTLITPTLAEAVLASNDQALAITVVAACVVAAAEARDAALRELGVDGPTLTDLDARLGASLAAADLIRVDVPGAAGDERARAQLDEGRESAYADAGVSEEAMTSALAAMRVAVADVGNGDAPAVTGRRAGASVAGDTAWQYTRHPEEEILRTLAREASSEPIIDMEP